MYPLCCLGNGFIRLHLSLNFGETSEACLGVEVTKQVGLLPPGPTRLATYRQKGYTEEVQCPLPVPSMLTMWVSMPN